MGRQYAKLWTAGYELADQKERNRRTARPETYRGAYADLCMAIDRSESKEAPGALRYWAARWAWHKTEVERFLVALAEAKVLTITTDSNGHRGIRSFCNVDAFVDADVDRLWTDKAKNDKGCDGVLLPECGRGCNPFVDELPDYQTVKKTSLSVESDQPRRQPSADAESFNRFWDAYPKKIGKKACLAKWKSRRLAGQIDRLLADIATRSASDRKWLEGFIPNPLTYLNGDRWEDEIEPQVPGKVRGEALTLEEQEAMRKQQEYLEKKRHAALHPPQPTGL